MSAADEERTISNPALSNPPRRGRVDAGGNALPPGTRIGEFEIGGVIGEGGFGIVYGAHDHSLGRSVAIKEYLPAALAARAAAMNVSVLSERHAETFAAGLRSFINEARLLAQFDHPSLLKVYRFWEANGTAYMVMPHYAGITLGKTLKQMQHAPDEAWLKDLLRQLLDALEQLHAANCYHRDIAPDNILILPDGQPLLLDFGAARRVIGDINRALTVIVKSGYAPVEQYGEVPGMTQGAWTDIYALGAVLHKAITGSTPPQAVSRFLADKYEPLARGEVGRYSDAFLRAIDRALAVKPQDRPQSVAELRALLGLDDRRQAPRAGAVAKAPVDETRTEATTRVRGEGGTRRGVAMAAAGALVATAAVLVAVMLWPSSGPSVDTAASSRSPATVQPRVEAVDSTATAAPIPTPETAPSPAASPVIAQPLAAPRLTASTPSSEAPAPAARAATPSAKSPAQPRANPERAATSRRCADIIQLTALGEPLSAEDRSYLTKECGQS